MADGRLVGPRELFDDISFDEARHQANTVANYMRSHGPFEPHRLSLGDMEYTTMPATMKRLEERWTDLPGTDSRWEDGLVLAEYLAQ